MKASKSFITQWKQFQDSVKDISKFYRKEIQEGTEKQEKISCFDFEFELNTISTAGKSAFQLDLGKAVIQS